MVAQKKILQLASSLALSLLLATSAGAMDNIIRPYESVRSAGMGGVRITTGLYDENFFGNPARNSANPKWRVVLFDFMGETNSNLPNTVKDLTGSGDTVQKISSSEGKNNHGRVQTAFPALYWPNVGGGKWSYAFGILMSSQLDLDLRKSYTVDPQAIVDAGPALSVSRKFMGDEQ